MFWESAVCHMVAVHKLQDMLSLLVTTLFTNPNVWQQTLAGYFMFRS